jgi:hypothetical protein
MATTTNYGWTTPDDTALVKDGAAAIRTLGSSVDTTTKALNPSTTLGDIEYRSSTANTNTRLGIGSTGSVLTVAGGVPTWATPASGALTLITTATAANTSTALSVNSCFSATYQNYLILANLKTSGNTNGYFNLRASGTDSSTGYYYSGFWNSSASSTFQGIASANNTYFSFRDIGQELSLFNFVIGDPFAAIDTNILFNGVQAWSGSNTEMAIVNGSHHVSTSYDGFTISSDANLTGTVRVYGYSNS